MVDEYSTGTTVGVHPGYRHNISQASRNDWSKASAENWMKIQGDREALGHSEWLGKCSVNTRKGP